MAAYLTPHAQSTEAQAHCFLRAISSALAWMEFRWSWGGAVGPGLGSGAISRLCLLNLSLVSPLYLPRSLLDDLVDGHGERVEASELLHGVRVRVRVRVRVSEGQGEGDG